MSQPLVKALVSGVVVAVASEVARHSSMFGAILISLPLTSIVALPVGLRRGLSFPAALLVACAVTALAYAGWIWPASRLGFDTQA